MKIACVAYLHGSGGAERQIIMLANNLSECGHDVSLIVLADNKSTYYINEKVVVYDLSSLELDGKAAIISRYYALKRVYKTIKPEVTIHYWLQSAYLSLLMDKTITGKIIYSERGDPYDSEYTGLLGLIRDITFEKIDGIVFQSNGAMNYFSNEIMRKSIVIANPVSVPNNIFLKPCTKRNKKIVSVGRLHEQKNQELLINAFNQLPESCNEYILEIYGEGPLKESLHNQIDSLGLTGRVFLKGTTDSIFEIIYESALFVLASNYEGMPNALMEAMALGVPCVSTDCRPGGARALIKNGINGYIVPVNDVCALSTAMVQVLNDPNINTICRNAQMIRDTHSPERIMGEWLDYLQRICLSW